MAPEDTKEPLLEIERLIAGGDGLARHAEGFVVFVPRTAVGDRVEVEYTEQQRQWRRGRVTRMVDAGPARREPVCEYYDRCGGCQLQHLEYAAQLEAKSAIISDSFSRLGGITVDRVDVHGSRHELAYRNRVSFVARRNDDAIRAGYHAYDDADDIVDVAACPLAEEPINQAWAMVRETLAEMLPEISPGANRSPDLRLTLRATANGDVGLVVEGDARAAKAAGTLAKIEALKAIWIADEQGRLVSHTGASHLNDTWAGMNLPLAGNAFLQVNRDTAMLLDAYVLEQCGDVVGQRVVDAYCGFGLRSIELARAGAIVTGIDADAPSVSTAITLANELSLGVAFTAAMVEGVIDRQLPADIVLLNPPRRGVNRRVIAALCKKAPKRIVYVSCDPATLARDIKGLGKQFELSACRGFDLFPQTAHVETVVTMTRR